MINKLFLALAKMFILKIKNYRLVLDLSDWILDTLPADYLVIKKINDKLNYQNIRSDPSYLIRRIQALRSPDIAGILIRAGLVPDNHIASDSQGNLQASVTITFARQWIDEHYK